MSLFSESAEMLTSACNELKAVAGSYKFFADSTSVNIRCWEGRTESQASTGTMDSENHYVDWIFAKSQIVVSDVQKEPRRGDRLTVDGKVYEVLPLQDGGPAYELSGIERAWFRVHTKIR